METQYSPEGDQPNDYPEIICPCGEIVITPLIPNNYLFSRREKKCVCGRYWILTREGKEITIEAI